MIYNMKQIYLLIISVLLSGLSYAQAPKIIYKAVIRDVSNELVSEKEVDMKISILQAVNDSDPNNIYTEKHTTTTDEQGSVSIDVGTGTTSNDFEAEDKYRDFNNIDWSVGKYSIKAEIDINRENNYTNLGTDLISNDFFVKNSGNINADDVSDDFSDHKFVTAEEKSQITRNKIQIDTLKKNVNKLSEKLSSINSREVILNGLLHKRIKSLEEVVFPERVLKIGDKHKGGFIFHIFEPGDAGYVAGETHGLIAAMSDEPRVIAWTLPDYQNITVPGGGARSDKNGAANTDAIIAQIGIASKDYAAGLCRLYSTPGNDDEGKWYLPSISELKLMFENLADSDVNHVNGGDDDPNNIGKFNKFYPGYWSSTEKNEASSLRMFFDDGLRTYTTKDNELFVRPIRAF